MKLISFVKTFNKRIKANIKKLWETDNEKRDDIIRVSSTDPSELLSLDLIGSIQQKIGPL